jgi:hypothetical protein
MSHEYVSNRPVCHLFSIDGGWDTNEIVGISLALKVARKTK